MPDHSQNLSKPLRVGINASVSNHLLRHLPASVEAVRYSLDSAEPIAVDVFVPPGFGSQAAAVLPRVRTRYIQSVSAGVEAILPLIPQGVTLMNAKGVHDSSTAEWAVSAILASLKWFPLYGELQGGAIWGGRGESDRHWHEVYGSPQGSATPVLLEELCGKTVLIVGYGSIGKAIEARLLPFEPGRILRLARTARQDDRGSIYGMDALNELLPEAEIVILITPLTPETHHLIGREQLGRMQRGALLVNAARGAVVDTDALVDALTSRHIRAALDVTDPEPLPAEHPLWRAPGLLLTPHIAGSTPLFLENVFRFVGKQLGRLLDGKEPENIIRGAY